MMMKKALITGITGQDGSYLTEFLLDKGYEVHGIVRRNSVLSRDRIDRISGDQGRSSRNSHLKLHYGDMLDLGSLMRVLGETKPDEVYNLAAQSHVKVSFEQPLYTADVTGKGALNLFEAIRLLGMKPKIYQAGSSEMYGKVLETPQKESTPFYPRSPYGCAKVFAHWSAVNYREAFDLFISNGILFNHESPRRGENFVTRKVTLGAARIKLGRRKDLALGNLDAKRDWGFAKDYVEAMWLMLQQNTPDDFVVATGETHSVRELCEVAFGELGLDYQKYVQVDPAYYRPTEVDLLLGSPAKATEKLGWKPKTSFKELITMMVRADYAALEKKYANE
jgi:GDPmannose 4,6-dehydratase